MPKFNLWIIIFGLAVFAFLFGVLAVFFPSDFTENNNNFQVKVIKTNVNLDDSAIESAQSNKISNGPFHYSAFSDKNFFETAFEKAGEVRKEKNKIIGAIVNHHLLAPDLIAKTLASAASDEPKTVVLISPNHFFAGRGQTIASSYDWQTPYGILQADKETVIKLEQSGAASIEEEPFEKEHGIFNVISFIKKTIPNDKFIPLIIKDTASEKDKNAIISALEKTLPENSLIIASFDFSHYLPSDVADFHDKKSKNILDLLDHDNIGLLDIDSRPGLEIFLKLIKERGAKSFNILAHTNSARVLNDKNITETTSYINGVFTNKENIAAPAASVLVFGDLMLDRFVRTVIAKKGMDYIFKNTERLYLGNDLILTNLEGSFTDFAPNPDPNGLKFTFDPKLIPDLKKIGFNVFNLANNHALDFGIKGFNQSKEYLEKNNIDYFGDPQNTSELSVIKNIRGLKIGFVGFSAFNKKINPVIEEIKKLKSEADIVAVYTHWGTEYNEDFTKTQQDQARELVDAGADVIFGSHPHVMEPIEIYKGKIIFYSLGNFVFDQLFSESTQKELAVGAVFGKNHFDYYLFPLESKNIQLNLLSGDKKDIILRDLADKSEVSESLKEQIKNGKITVNF